MGCLNPSALPRRKRFRSEKKKEKKKKTLQEKKKEGGGRGENCSKERKLIGVVSFSRVLKDVLRACFPPTEDLDKRSDAFATSSHIYLFFFGVFFGVCFSFQAFPLFFWSSFSFQKRWGRVAVCRYFSYLLVGFVSSVFLSYW